MGKKKLTQLDSFAKRFSSPFSPQATSNISIPLINTPRIDSRNDLNMFRTNDRTKMIKNNLLEEIQRPKKISTRDADVRKNSRRWIKKPRSRTVRAIKVTSSK